MFTHVRNTRQFTDCKREAWRRNANWPCEGINYWLF